MGSKSQKHDELKLQIFLQPNDEEIPNETAKFIAKTQSHMIEIFKMNVKNYFKSNFIYKSCNLSECNQSYVLYCSALIGKNSLITYIPNYEDIFDDMDPQGTSFQSSHNDGKFKDEEED